MSASDQLARLLTLIPWLVAHPGVTKDEVARTFGITTAQLERDLELAACAEVGRDNLASLDIDYWDDEISVINAQTVDRPLQLRVDEAVTLLVGLRALAAVPGLADRDVVSSALAKVEEAIGSQAGTLTDVDQSPGPERSEIVTDVHDALSRGRQVRLTYWNPSRDEVRTRRVDPMRLVTVGSDGYLQGWCHEAEDVRTFRLDRIVEVEVLAAEAAPPAQARLSDVAQPGQSWRGGSADLEVVLDLTADSRWIVDYHAVEHTEELPDGGLRVLLRTGELDWARRLVLRLSGGAAVVSPAELAAAVRDEAAAARSAYT